MGGIGSGRRATGRSTVESCKRVDLRYFKRHGLLRPGMAGSLRWTVRGEPSGDIRYRVGVGVLILSYRYRFAGGEWQPVEQEIVMTETPCHFGGGRYWFVCPGCDRRCLVLCAGGKLFLCRHCYRLPYQTQLEGEHGRACIRRDKLEALLYGDGRKRRWRRTTDKLIAQMIEAHDVAGRAFEALLYRLQLIGIDL